ncbi:MAG: hypothetical protein QF612_07275, partial [Candidatus Thalassarchaeaceae archaeon]|nr:hypothetical protein [Candidatus Thalassarchaeaceae archaeon]
MNKNEVKLGAHITKVTDFKRDYPASNVNVIQIVVLNPEITPCDIQIHNLLGQALLDKSTQHRKTNCDGRVSGLERIFSFP